MKVVGIDYMDADNVYTVYFSAPHRVDFRALVRDLARNLRARVELRQIGPRDEARLQGGIGPCGRDLCCATFLKDFEPVSVRMAKDQDLPVNPLRIAGACGRLMCCLKYEHPLYMDAHNRMPRVGLKVDTPEGRGPWSGATSPRTPSWSGWTTAGVAARARPPRSAPRASSTTRCTARRWRSPRAAPRVAAGGHRCTYTAADTRDVRSRPLSEPLR